MEEHNYDDNIEKINNSKADFIRKETNLNGVIIKYFLDVT